MINTIFWFVDTEQEYRDAIQNGGISPKTIVFIGESKEIYLNGKRYGSASESEIIAHIQHYEFRYKNATDTPIKPTTGSNGLSDGWMNDPEEPNIDAGEYTWMTQCIVIGENGYGTWTTPIRITGGDGKPGKDGVNGKNGQNGADGKDGVNGTSIEFIYTRNNTGSTPATPATIQQDDWYGTSNGVTWTDNPKGVSNNLKYEFVSTRTKSSNGVWSAYSTPVVWSKWGEKGMDGDGYEYIFILSETTPEISYSGNNGKTVLDDDFVPAGWSDNPLVLDESNPYEWVSVRKKKDGYWSDFSTPSIWAHWAAKGTNGGHYEFAYKNSANKPESPSTGSTMVDAMNSGWSASSQTPTTGQYTWMTQVFVSGDGAYGAWTEPTRITGGDGKNGSDGLDGENGKNGTWIEFIYTRNNTGEAVNTPETNQVDDWHGTSRGVTWTDNPQGVSNDMMYEFVTTRTKKDDVWGAYSTPVIWSKWGEKGQDGDGYEYIYKRTQTADIPTKPTSSQEDEYIPSGWDDEPASVSESMPYQWVCVRKKTNDIWGDFSIPSLWARWSTPGTSGGHYEFRYKNSQIQPNAPTGTGMSDGWSNIATTPDSNSYIWMSQCYVDGSDNYGSWTTPARLSGIDGAGGMLYDKDNSSITYAISAYGSAPSGKDYPDDIIGWADTIPSAQQGKYLWTRDITAYNNNGIIVTTTSYGVSYYGIDGVNGIDGKDGKDGLNGKDGVDGAPGTNTYFHVAYANKDAVGNIINFSTSDPTDREYLGTYVDSIVTDSTTPSDYTWVLTKGAQGEDGQQGIPGQNGTDGKTSYLHIKYSNDGLSFTDNNGETPGYYLGQYVDFVVSDSNDPSKYKWALIKGVDGNDGKDGVGVNIKGAVESASSLPTSGMNAGDAYMVDVYLYIWTGSEWKNAGRIKGEDGKDGTNGINGTSAYLHIAYANSADGSVDFSTTKLSNKTYEYIGVYTDSTVADSENYSSYAWSKIKGEKGENGEDGTSVEIDTNRTFVKYATSESIQRPRDDQFSTQFPSQLTQGHYLWILNQTAYIDVADPLKSYSVSYLGHDGNVGDAGTDGYTTHFAYATSADGSLNFSTTNFSGATYIGTYRDQNSTDSTNYRDYTWTPWKGDDGEDAVTITVNPSSVILTQDMTNPNDFGISSTSPITINIVATKGSSSTNIVSSITNVTSQCTSNSSIQIVSASASGKSIIVSGVSSAAVSNGYTTGIITATVKIDGISDRLISVPVCLNLLGKFKTTIIGDVETSVATKMSAGYDENGGIKTLQNFGEYIRSSEKNISTLLQTVYDEDNGLVEKVSSFEQTVGGISGRVLNIEKDYVTSGSLSLKADKADLKFTRDGLEAAGIHLDATTPNNSTINLIAGKVTFKNADGSINNNVSIDTNNGILNATNAKISGEITATKITLSNDVKINNSHITGFDTLQSDVTAANTNASNALSTATTASSTASSAISKANSSVKDTQRIYRTAPIETATMEAPTEWVSDVTGGNNKWTSVRPEYNSTYKTLFTALQYKKVDDTISCTTPVIDKTTTVIDGGNITTGKIAAQRIDAENLKVEAANITGQLTANQINTTGLVADSINSDTVISNELNATSGLIGGFNINSDSISSGGLFLHSQTGSSDSSISTTKDVFVGGVLSKSVHSGMSPDGFRTSSLDISTRTILTTNELNSDGSGSLGQGGISWDSNGNFSATDTFVNAILNALDSSYHTQLHSDDTHTLSSYIEVYDDNDGSDNHTARLYSNRLYLTDDDLHNTSELNTEKLTLDNYNNEGAYKSELTKSGLTVSSTVENSETEISSTGITSDGSVTASSFVKTGGTSSQFLKADGSVDSNTYAVESTIKDYIDLRIMDAVNLVLNELHSGYSLGKFMGDFEIRRAAPGGPELDNGEVLLSGELSNP